MSAKLCPKVILEGTRLTFKTEIAFNLNEHPRFVGARKYHYHSPLISAEWCAFTNYPWGRGLINFLPEIDRFPLSTRTYQMQAHGTDYSFRWLEQRLKPLGFHLVLITRSPESFAAARQERLKVSGNPSQYDDLQVFIEEQGLMRKLASETMLPLLELEISDNDVTLATERIVDWMESTGGLWHPE